MHSATLHLHSRFTVGEVDPRIFGGFLEHLGRAVYEGVYDPASKHADEYGCRTDVCAALRDLDFTVMRYPGGNFVSGYRWQDGVGPRDQRPQTLDLAWGSIETNQFGTGEFLDLCERMNWQPMMAVNLGTASPEDARNLVEYTNGRAETQYVLLRQSNGRAKPWDVKLWCLGNEMDGPWQIGHCPADEYGRRAQQASAMMKMVDPSIETVACGSSYSGMRTWIDWDRTVLDVCAGAADYISLHHYVGNRGDNTPEFLAVTSVTEKQIDAIDALCKADQSRRHSDKRVYLSFDEWNVWYRTGAAEKEPVVAPHLLEETYNVEDALVVAGFLNAFIRRADCVKIANLAQIVNVIAPIRTQGDAMVRQTIFHAIRMFTQRRTGTSLAVHAQCDSCDAGEHGSQPLVDCSAILHGDLLHLFVVNRSVDQPCRLSIEPADFAVDALVNGELLTGDAKQANTFAQPDAVLPTDVPPVSVEQGRAAVDLPPLCVAAFTLRVS